MPVELRTKDDGHVLDYLCSGALTGQALQEANEELLATPARIARLRCSIVDMTAVGSLQASATELRQVAQQNLRMADTVPPGFVLAVVAPADATFGLARMWEVFAEGTGWEIMVFRERADAEGWVRRRVRERSGVEPAGGEGAP